MAFNPSPEVKVARAAANKLGALQAVIVYVTPDGRVGMASFGQTKELCEQAGHLGDGLFDLATDWLKQEGD